MFIDSNRNCNPDFDYCNISWHHDWLSFLGFGWSTHLHNCLGCFSISVHCDNNYNVLYRWKKQEENGEETDQREQPETEKHDQKQIMIRINLFVCIVSIY